MTKPFASRVGILLLLTVSCGYASAACISVTGSVRLTPDQACTIESQVTGPSFTHECFSVQLSLFGFPVGNGYAGVTTEHIVSTSGGAAMTPAFIANDDSPSPRQLLQTARSVVSLGLLPSRRTTLYTSDVIVIQPDTGAVTEQIVITGTDGRGAYANATGHLTVIGNSIGQPAPVMGNICLP